MRKLFSGTVAVALGLGLSLGAIPIGTLVLTPSTALAQNGVPILRVRNRKEAQGVARCKRRQGESRGWARHLRGAEGQGSDSPASATGGEECRLHPGRAEDRRPEGRGVT